MYNAPEQMITANKENLETVLEFAGIAITGAEKLIDLQVKASKAAFADAAKSAKSMASAKDISALTDIQNTTFQPASEKTASYVRSVYSAMAETQGEMAKFLEERIATVNKQFVSILDQASKNVPGGSDVAVSAVKSALAAANQAYDAFSKATRQVNEATEATINAATQTPSKKKVA